MKTSHEVPAVIIIPAGSGSIASTKNGKAAEIICSKGEIVQQHKILDEIQGPHRTRANKPSASSTHAISTDSDHDESRSMPSLIPVVIEDDDDSSGKQEENSAPSENPNSICLLHSCARGSSAPDYIRESFDAYHPMDTCLYKESKDIVRQQEEIMQQIMQGQQSSFASTSSVSRLSATEDYQETYVSAEETTSDLSEAVVNQPMLGFDLEDEALLQQQKEIMEQIERERMHSRCAPVERKGNDALHLIPACGVSESSMFTQDEFQETIKSFIHDPEDCKFDEPKNMMGGGQKGPVSFKDDRASLSEYGKVLTSVLKAETKLEHSAGQNVTILNRRQIRAAARNGAGVPVCCSSCRKRYWVSDVVNVLYCPSCEVLTPL